MKLPKPSKPTPEKNIIGFYEFLEAVLFALMVVFIVSFIIALIVGAALFLLNK